ncbi:MAG: acetyltransferase [Agriterribacter sp.]
MISLEKKICIAGAGGLGREVLSYILDELDPKGIKAEDHVCFMQSDDHIRETQIMGINVIPLSKFNPSTHNVVVAIGNPQVRKKFVENLPADTKYTSIIHPSAIIYRWVDIDEGCIIMAGSIISSNIKMGKHIHLNAATTIGHDCTLGDYFTTAPAVNISGNCLIGECVYFGTNAAVKQGITICNNVTIGMGGIVVKNITEEGVYTGVPAAKLIKKK